MVYRISNLIGNHNRRSLVDLVTTTTIDQLRKFRNARWLVPSNVVDDIDLLLNLLRSGVITQPSHHIIVIPTSVGSGIDPVHTTKGMCPLIGRITCLSE